MGKLSLIVGFGAGYVAGAAAGRQRYEQIRTQAQKVLQNPKVQQTTSKVQTQATQLVGMGKSKVNEKVESRKGGSAPSTGTGTDAATTYDVVEIPPTTSSDPFGTTTSGPTTGTGYGTTSTTTTGTTYGSGTTGLGGSDDPTLDRPGTSGL